jgi:hypothetical protein
MAHHNGLDLDDLKSLRIPLDDSKPTTLPKPDSEEAIVMVAPPQDEEDTIPNVTPLPITLCPPDEGSEPEIQILHTPELFSHETIPVIAAPEQIKLKESEIGELETVAAPPSEHVLKNSSDTSRYPLIFFAYHLGMLAAFAGILALVLWQQNKKIKLITQQVMAATTPAPACMCPTPSTTVAVNVPPVIESPTDTPVKVKVVKKKRSVKKPAWMLPPAPVATVYTRLKGWDGIEDAERVCNAPAIEAWKPKYRNNLERFIAQGGPPTNNIELRLPCPPKKAKKLNCFNTF